MISAAVRIFTGCKVSPKIKVARTKEKIGTKLINTEALAGPISLIAICCTR